MDIKYNNKTYTFDVAQAIKSGILKEKDGKARTIQELTDKYRLNTLYGYDITQDKLEETTLVPAWNLGYQLTPEDAEALATLSLLLKFRRDWVGDWHKSSTSYYIMYQASICRISYGFGHGVLSFPTEDMAKEFRDTFLDLLKKCKYYL